MKLEGKRVRLPSTAAPSQEGWRNRLPEDREIRLTDLAAKRLAYVAAETGARFVRERIEIEPIEWLLRPRRLFGGKTAVHACQRSDGLQRAIVLHGLGIGLDAYPEIVSAIPATEFMTETARRQLGFAPPHIHNDPTRREQGRPALYSCAISSELDSGHIQIFAAMIAHSVAEVRHRLRQRFGALLEDEANIRLGFDWSEPLACAMVSEAMADLLMLAAEEPTSALAQGLDFQIEQRFAS